MLSIASVSAHHAAHYYSADNYCSPAESEQASQWQGQAAEKLKLSGTVEAQQFTTLLYGHTPEGMPLQQHLKINHVAALDLTLSAPKSISIAALWGGDTQLAQTHHQAVLTTLNFIESHSGARRWDGHGQSFQHTGNLAIAQFAHTTSRAQDPQLHTHNIVLNTTYTGQDWRALDARFLFKHRKLWQTIYHQELALGCQQYGYRLTRNQGHLELAGYGQEQITNWSKRRQQILQVVGIGASPAQKQVACLQTRPRKLAERSLEALRKQWESESQQLGLNIQHPQPSIKDFPNTAERYQAAQANLNKIIDSLGRTDRLSKLTLVEHIFGPDGWGNPQISFGYSELDQVITNAIQAGQLHEQSGNLSRCAPVQIAPSVPKHDTIATAYPQMDAIDHFTHDIARHQHACLVAPVEHHSQLTKAIRKRLQHMGVLISPQIAQQHTSRGIQPIELYVGDRIRIPGRVGQVSAQVIAADHTGWLQLKHRNGKVTQWQLTTPKAFEFDWVHWPEQLPKRKIDVLYIAGDIEERVLALIHSKTTVPIRICGVGTEIARRHIKPRDSLLQKNHPAPDSAWDLER